VSGERRFDLALMRAGRGDWIAKVGAEGVQAVGLRRSGVGIAIKVGDGAGRALPPTTIAVLEALGVMDECARRELAPWAAPRLHNARGTPAGELRAVVVLDKHPGRRDAQAPAAVR
jgi:L-asparaginase II